MEVHVVKSTCASLTDCRDILHILKRASQGLLMLEMRNLDRKDFAIREGRSQFCKHPLDGASDLFRHSPELNQLSQAMRA